MSFVSQMLSLGVGFVFRANRPLWKIVTAAALTIGCGGASPGANDAFGTLPGVGTGGDGNTTGGGTDEPADSSAGTSGPACECTANEVAGCASSAAETVCAADCTGLVERPCSPFEVCALGQCGPADCEPGETLCDDKTGVRTCNAQGTGFDDPIPCGTIETCSAGQCVALCEAAASDPSSEGCSFFALKMDNYYTGVADALVAGNPSATRTANVQLWFADDAGVEVAQGNAVEIAPGAVVQLALDAPEIESGSMLRTGGAFRVSADIPIVAYQHSPIDGQATNDASMLLPEPSLARDHVVASYPASTFAGHLAYFDVIGVTDGTTVTWTAPVATLAGDGVVAVAAGGTGSAVLNRHDVLQVAAAFGEDITGAVVEADQPIWVMGASACPSVPVGASTCDHIEEQMLPIAYWGTTYVAAHSPQRGDESFHWRIFAGDDGISITTTPDQVGVVALNRGEWVEIVTEESFMVEANGPVLPVQYLESQNNGAGTGDPAMVQLVPAEQFLSRYTFATGIGYDEHYVQVIRPIGGADVAVDGAVVTDYEVIGTFEVSDHPISEGGHLARSEEAFGIISYGYTNITSYAYPGGLRLSPLNPEG